MRGKAVGARSTLHFVISEEASLWSQPPSRATIRQTADANTEAVPLIPLGNAHAAVEYTAAHGPPDRGNDV